MTAQTTVTKILVIDDEEQMRTLLKYIFEEQGFVVDTASDGNEGIKKYDKREYDIVLTDIIMPEREGISTILELVNRKPNVKIIAMSGFNSGVHANNLRVAKKLGSSNFIEKPFTSNEIINMVNSII